MRLFRTVIALCVLAGLFPLAAAQDAKTPQELCEAAEPAKLTRMQFEAAENVLDRTIDYRAILCASAGAIYVDLYENLTPITVNNFVFLAGQGYYDSTTFHRVIPDFMAQGGDPTATGRGGPGYQFGDEPLSYLTFDRPYLLAMANAGPGTNGSQFFITTAPTPHLNYKHTIFGDALVGQEHVEAIRERDPASATEPGETLRTVLIISDHSQVDNSEVIELDPATQDELVATFGAFGRGLPPELPISEDSGLLSTADISAAIPSDLQDAFTAYAEDHGHRYRYSLTILNGNCDSSVFFSSLGYQVDVFESGAAAAAALYDSFNLIRLESQGFQLDDILAQTYTRPEPTCAAEEGVQVLRQYTHGRFLVSIDVLVDVTVLDRVDPTQLMSNLSFQIEPAFAALYRPEIR